MQDWYGRLAVESNHQITQRQRSTSDARVMVASKMTVLISVSSIYAVILPGGRTWRKLSCSHCVAVNSITRGAVQTLVEYYDWEMGWTLILTELMNWKNELKDYPVSNTTVWEYLYFNKNRKVCVLAVLLLLCPHVSFSLPCPHWAMRPCCQ